MSLFRKPKVQQSPAPDPSDLENRRNTERRARLATGGTQSTLISRAMATAAGQPTATLTGVG